VEGKYDRLKEDVFFQKLPPELGVVALSLYKIGQAQRLFPEKIDPEKATKLLQSLVPVDLAYRPIGGIIGYHNEVLKRLLGQTDDEKATYSKPEGIDIRENFHEFVREAIMKSEFVAEIYPVGGAGDRMNLICKDTGDPLPVAMLEFCGHTLIERLIRDVEAREYLLYKLTGKKICTPIALMTSLEKKNHERIYEYLASKNWFGRGRDSFLFFTQPQVPVLDEEGNWLLKAPYELYLKPGGHGVLWSQAQEEGVFDDLKARGIKKLLIRQINNPIAGTDQGLLAFLGYGLKEDKDFGFASCERRVFGNEGMDVVVKKGAHVALTNVEYTEFKQKGIEDKPDQPDSPYSKFPANTNILFADINAILEEQSRNPIPGMTLNMKTKFKEVICGRLESTMQNIADGMPIENTYLTYNDRIKTISVTKKAEGPSETPETCFRDMMTNARDLLENHCGFKVAEEFTFLYTPKLGPLYEIIGQKIRGGTMKKGSELIIETPDVDIENLELSGSLMIKGKCTLKNVKVLSQLEITCEEGAEFYAENAVFEKPTKIHMTTPSNTWEWRYAFEKDGGIRLTKETF